MFVSNTADVALTDVEPTAGFSSPMCDDLWTFDKMMVDAWAAAAEPDKTTLFYSAYGVRQIEVGLASILGLLFGLTVCVYGVALISDRNFVTWLGWLAIIGGIPTAIAGVVIAYTGFSGLAMSINMPSSSLILIWMMALGVLFWRRDTGDSATGSNE